MTLVGGPTGTVLGGMATLTVAVDATPLLGSRTGVGVFVRGLLAALPGISPDLRVAAYGVTWTGRHHLAAALPAGVVQRRGWLPMPAGPLLRVWEHAGLPPAEWWTGTVDVVHGTNFVVPPTRRAAQVVSVHDLTALHFPELCSPASRRYPELVRQAIRRGAFVHTDSAFVAAEVVEAFAVDADRVRTVPPGVASPVVASGPTAGAPPAPYILAMSTVEPRKDLPTLVRAFDQVAAAIPDVRLVLAGPPGWGTPALDEALSFSRHRARVDRLGWVSDAERSELLRDATVLAYPSLYEGFGLPPLEAMAAGVPVVTTTAGSIPEVVGDGARLVSAGDDAALAEALCALLADERERGRLAERGRARAAEYTWDRCASGLAGLYRDAAGGAGP